MGLSSSVGNASSFLNGIQAKRVSFDDPCAEISGPQSAKPGLFFLENPPPFLQVLWQVLMVILCDAGILEGKGCPALWIPGRFSRADFC